MKAKTSWIHRIDAWLDALGEKAKQKEIRIPTDLVGGLFFLLFGIGMLLVIPGQIVVKKKEIVNGRQFPMLLMGVIIVCASLLILTQILKLLRHQPIRTTRLNLLVELRALLLFFNMLIYYLICRWSGSFAVGSCVFAVLMLCFFRCKDGRAYLITLAAALLIWATFRFGLNVNF